jgi:phosphoglycolate phosphatase
VLPRPSALLLDLDGTLVDSRRDIAEACNATRVAHGQSPLALEAIVGMVGDGARALVARAFDAALDEPIVDAALATFQAFYLAHPCVHTVMLEGARELLDEAAALRLPCAVVTNKPRAVSVALLEALTISPFFRVIWAGGDGPLKPAADGLLHAIARLDATASTTWMIGDGPQDILAGQAAGCVTIGVPGIAERERLLASAPDVVVESLLDVRDALAALFKEHRDEPRPP